MTTQKTSSLYIQYRHILLGSLHSKRVLLIFRVESLVVMAATRLKTKSLLSFICLLNLLNLDTCLGQKKRKPIVTSLNAKWSNTPILLEVVSFLFIFSCTDSTLDKFLLLIVSNNAAL